MTVTERILSFEKLAICLKDTLEDKQTGSQKLRRQIEEEYNHNAWFIPFFVQKSIGAIIQMLDREKLTQWISPYKDRIENAKISLRIGVIMAGNIPLVGFHDFLSVIMAGHTFVGKLSSQDAHLLPIIAEILCEIEPRFKDKIEFCPDKLGKIDRLIATGSNNAANYFGYYFQKYPSIIRKHCNSIAVLDGNESEDDLKKLADDVFLYFGLGCRSVSKIYIPRNYNFEPLFTTFNSYQDIINQHNKYLNNLEYQKTVHLLNAVPFLDMGVIICKENTALASPIAVLHYQYYDDLDSVVKETSSLGDELQCVASNAINNASFVRLGETQFPQIEDYANGINTLEFLLSAS
jgi:hypothetical protein